MMAKHKGVFIVIEGADGSGKATQTELLVERLKKAGYQTHSYSFPRYYDSRAGKLIGELLSGKHGDFMNLSPYISSLPYVLDRAVIAPQIRKQLSEGAFVVADRFTPSNMAHQMAKLPPSQRDAFAQFIEQLEYQELNIPTPDVVLYLSVPAEISFSLILQKAKRGYLDEGKARDVAERNHEHQQKTREVYLQLAKERANWHIIDCAPTGLLQSKEAIHEMIWEQLQPYIQP